MYAVCPGAKAPRGESPRLGAMPPVRRASEKLNLSDDPETQRNFGGVVLQGVEVDLVGSDVGIQAGGDTDDLLASFGRDADRALVAVGESQGGDNLLIGHVSLQ